MNLLSAQVRSGIFLMGQVGGAVDNLALPLQGKPKSSVPGHLTTGCWRNFALHLIYLCNFIEGYVQAEQI
jgi:hypothetical protein